MPPVPGLYGILEDGPRGDGQAGDEFSRTAAAGGRRTARGLPGSRPSRWRCERTAARGGTSSRWRVEHDVGAIVIGQRGVGRAERVLMGSVSSAVVNHADRPVLVVPAVELGAGRLLQLRDGPALPPPARIRGQGARRRRPAVARHTPLEFGPPPAHLARAAAPDPRLPRGERHPDVPDGDGPRALREPPGPAAVPRPGRGMRGRAGGRGGDGQGARHPALDPPGPVHGAELGGRGRAGERRPPSSRCRHRCSTRWDSTTRPWSCCTSAGRPAASPLAWIASPVDSRLSPNPPARGS